MFTKIFTRQRYSIKFLFLEMFLASCAFALMREGLVRGGESGWLMVVASIIVVGATLGGAFGSFLGGIGVSLGTLFSVGFFVSLFGPPTGLLIGLLFIFALMAAKNRDRQSAARRADAKFRRQICPHCSSAEIDRVNEPGTLVQVGRCKKCGHRLFLREDGSSIAPSNAAS